MAESHVATALVGKYTEMAGLIDHHKKEMARLAGDLTHLEATLKLFSPEIDRRTLSAKEHRTRSSFFRPQECQRGVLDIFREADGAALSGRHTTSSPPHQRRHRNKAKASSSSISGTFTTDRVRASALRRKCRDMARPQGKT